MANIIKYLTCLIFFFFFGNIFSQGLILPNLNLNSGGVIYDVAFDKFNNVYIVVGNFTSISGHPVKNIAYINADDFTVNTSPYLNVITDINGPIFTVAFKDTLSLIFPTNHRYFLFLGGNFTSVTVDGVISTRNGVLKLDYYKTGVRVPHDHPYSLDTWNADLAYPSGAYVSPVVKDIVIWKDTVLLAGDFSVAKESTTYDIRKGCAAFNIYHGGILAYPEFTITSPNDYTFNTFKKVGNVSYLSGASILGSGKARIFKLNAAGSRIVAFNPVTAARNEYYNVTILNDSLLIVGLDLDGLDNRMTDLKVIRTSNGTDKIDHELILGHPNAKAASSFDLYKNFIYQTQPAVAGHYLDGYEINPGVPVVVQDWNGLSNNLAVNDQSGGQIINNVLFVSASNLNTVVGTPKVGLALFCLEPSNLQTFTHYDTTICQTDTITYTVGQANYADGYIWEFSGTGIDMRNTGAPENLTDTLYSSDGPSWTMPIRFTESFTEGILTVTAFSNCNGTISATTLLKSNPISIPISTNPLPTAFAGADTTLSCLITELTLHGESGGVEDTYSWNTVGGDALFESLGQDLLIDEAGNYRLRVMDEIGCLNFDTITVDLDTIRPNFDPISGPFDLTCNDTVRTYLGFCNNATDTTCFWIKLGSGDTVSNPISVDLPGQYQFFTINNQNGCIDSLGAPILVYLNQPSPNIEIIGYDDLPVDLPLDSIDCYTPMLTLECYSDTLSTILNWVEADSTSPIGDLINIEAGGNYYILAQNTLNGCFNFTGINIAADFTKPTVILPVVSSINCSNDSLVLNGSTIFLDTVLTWTGEGIADSPNPLTVFEPGTYYLTVTKNDNGCSEMDSLEIISDNSIDVILANDTVVCDQSEALLSVGYVGEISGITYLWDNGSVANEAIYTAGVDDFAVVEVFGDDGCYGTDTLFIEIPPAAEVDFEGFQPCGDGESGSIVATPVAGLAPFEYSLDGISFQTSPVISGLSFGTYTIWVKDSLDCLYEFGATIDEFSALPTPEFLFSTYNFQLDTVILVDVSSPPADSVDWEFSEEIVWVGELEGAPLIALPDTGSFLITMNAYFGECLVSISKNIYVSEFDSTYATFNNQNGIQSLSLYPNPTTGIFTVSVDFYKKQRVSLSIQDMLGYVYEQQSFDETAIILETFELSPSAVNGTYVLHIVSEYDAAYITFVLNR